MNRLGLADRLAGAAGALAFLAAAVGLALPSVYRDPPFWVQQARGTDLATLFLAVPALFGALALLRGGTDAARPVLAGGLLYLVYSYAIYSFSVAMNPLTVVYIAVLGLAVFSLALNLLAGTPVLAGPTTTLPLRTTAAVLVVVASLFGLMWLAQIGSATTTGALPADLVRSGLPTNPVYALDLALFLPLCLVAAFGLVRNHRAAAAFAIPMLIWLSLTSAGIVAAFGFAAIAGDVVPLPVALMVAGIGIVAALLAAAGLGGGLPGRYHPKSARP